MTHHAGRRVPPPLADELLERFLPEGVLGQSILGDLHQEFGDLDSASQLAMPRLWYWRTALGLALRYSLVHLKTRMLEQGSGGIMGVEMMTTLLADLRYGLRMLVKTPLISGVAILTVALGVALTTHTFSSVYGTILRGLPVPDSDRLVAVMGTRLDLGLSETELSIHDFEDLRAQQTSFDDLAAFNQGTVNMAGDDGPPERFAGAYVSDNMFEHLGVQPLLGRTFRAGEDDVDATPVIVLGYHVWQNRFAGDPDILGRSIRVNGRTTEIIGVMPEGFRFPFLEDVWVPHHIDVLGLARGSAGDVGVFGRLREGVTIQVAGAELATIAAQFAAAFPETNENSGMAIKPYEERFMPPAIQAVLWVMLVATFGVLLIACTNVTNLLMARTSIRSKEIAIRTALGAGRWRVVRQLMMESLVLASIGGIVGVGMAWVGVVAYRGAIADIYKPYWIDIRMDPAVLVFCVAVTALASVIAGIMPALRASGTGIGETLKDGTRGSSSLKLGKLSTALVISEIAVSCALLVGAGFMVRSVVNLNNVDLGFETEGVMTGQVGLFDSDYPDEGSRDQFFARLKDRLEALPGVEVAALGTNLPGLGGARYFFSVQGEMYATLSDYPIVTATMVTPDYFETFGVSFNQGRDFTPLEARLGGDEVAIVNQSFAERYLAGSPVIGAQVRLGLSDTERPWRRVVGVVPDMHIGGNVGGIGDDQVQPERFFLPQGALNASFMSIAVKTQGDPLQMAPAIRNLIAELDPNLPVYGLAPLAQAVDEATWAFGLFGTLFSIFGAVALFLAAVGLYGVMAFSVAQRRKEMGVRMALGAGTPVILRMIMTRGARQLAVGIVLGLALGAGMSRAMAVILYGVETGDPLVYLSITLTLGAAGLLACLIPARSATRTDPVVAMRAD